MKGRNPTVREGAFSAIDQAPSLTVGFLPCEPITRILESRDLSYKKARRPRSVLLQNSSPASEDRATARPTRLACCAHRVLQQLHRSQFLTHVCRQPHPAQ